MFYVSLVIAAILTHSASAKIYLNQVSLPDGRIVGGSDANIAQFPHQISMRYNGRHRCGGSIYSPNIVVSASHCVVDVDVTKMTIVAGSSRLTEKNIEIPVSRIIMHPKYKTYNNDYDVAILVLRGFIPFGPTAQPIALATKRPEQNTTVTVTGWGTQESGASSLPDQLQKVDLNIVSNTDCRKSYSSFLVTSRMLCAGVSGGGKDSCQGDSGGPLIVQNQLLGIVSWGFGCAYPNFPGVYASVPDLHDWIKEAADANKIEYAYIFF